MNLLQEGAWWNKVLKEKGLAILLNKLFDQFDFELDARTLSRTTLKSKTGAALILRHWRDGIAQVILKDTEGEVKVFSPDGKDWVNFVMTRVDI